MPRVLVIDSYDSFVYNLVQYLGELGADPIVVRNDELTVAEALGLAARRACCCRPGPGRPEDAASSATPSPPSPTAACRVLGVCLGHQAIGHVYGGAVVRAPQLMHGKTSPIEHQGVGVFAGLPVAADGHPLPQPGDRPGHDARLPGGHGHAATGS